MNKEENNKENIFHVISQFQQKGFESLSLEHLAISVIEKDFQKYFLEQTGINWQQKFQIKALERLKHAQFDINWLSFKSTNKHNALFTNIERCDFQKVKQYL